MKVAIVGGTGTLGRQLVSEFLTRGHDARILSRNAPEYRVNLATGEGLEAALAGCEVVIDASNNQSKKAATILVEGSRRLLRAAWPPASRITSAYRSWVASTSPSATSR